MSSRRSHQPQVLVIKCGPLTSRSRIVDLDQKSVFGRGLSLREGSNTHAT
jgi:hypothetical protein